MYIFNTFAEIENKKLYMVIYTNDGIKIIQEYAEVTYREKVEFSEIDLGSNTFKNSRNVVYYETRNGKFENLFTLELSDLDFLLTVNSIRDEKGRFLGKLVRNKVIQHKSSLTSGREYETKRVPNKFWLKDGDTTLLSVRADTPGQWIINGVFYIKVGKEEKIVKIEITDKETIISNQIRLSNNEIERANGIQLFSTENGGISFGLGGSK